MAELPAVFVKQAYVRNNERRENVACDRNHFVCRTLCDRKKDCSGDHYHVDRDAVSFYCNCIFSGLFPR